MKLLSLSFFIIILAFTNGCDRAEFTTDGTQGVASTGDETDNTSSGGPIPIDEIPECTSTGELDLCTTLKDSFERDEILKANGPSFGWSKIIDDRGSANGYRVDAQIYHEVDMGETPEAITDPATDEKRALYFTGRGGASVHSIFIISKAFDLSAYSYLTLRYEYVAMDLEVWNWRRKSGQENIRLEICEGTQAECEADLNSDKWVVYAQSEDNAGDGLDGHNQTLADWNTETVKVDLTQLDQETVKSFVFRIAVTVDEGFNSYNGGDPVLSSKLRDGVALDNVIAIVSTENQQFD